jgi:hypothetical protein
LAATSVKLTIWATAEPGTGIIAASIAILRPLFRKIALDVRAKTSSYAQSRKEPQLSDDSIPLTSQNSVSQAKYMEANVYSIRPEDPWRPTVIATEDVQRMILVKGKMIPAPWATSMV